MNADSQRLDAERRDRAAKDLQAYLEARGVDPARAELTALKGRPSFRFTPDGQLEAEDLDGPVRGADALRVIANDLELAGETYDPVAAGKAMAAEQKARTDLANRGGAFR